MPHAPVRSCRTLDDDAGESAGTSREGQARTVDDEADEAADTLVAELACKRVANWRENGP